MIKLGDYIVNEDVVVLVKPTEGGKATSILLKYTAEIRIEMPFEEAVGCFIEAGILPGAAGTDVVQVPSEDVLALTQLHREGFRYLARDYDGKLFAYGRAPSKGVLGWRADDREGSPKRVSKGCAFVTWDDEQPLSITAMLQDLNQ